MVDDDLHLRALESVEWPAAMTLAARAFHAEPFTAEIFGEAPYARFAQAHRFYQALPWQPTDLALGAFLDDVLVGVSVCSPVGECHLCRYADLEHPPQDPTDRLEWEFEVNTRTAHSSHGAHGWLSRLMVDPALQGSGIGRRLVAETQERLRTPDATGELLLECQPHREALYLTCGFRRVGTFPDPAGPDCMLMQADLPRRG